MSRTSTSDGFTLMEMLVALALSVMLLAALLPLWASLLGTSVNAQERLAQLQRWRVAAIRFERDLEKATAVGVSGLGCSPILEASPARVVMVTRGMDAGSLEIVAWEVVGGTLMRRRAPLQTTDLPGATSFTDSKTMLDGIHEGGLLYLSGAERLGDAPSTELSRRIDTIMMECVLGADQRTGDVRVTAEAGVGR